jgi:hypothetical protein
VCWCGGERGRGTYLVGREVWRIRGSVGEEALLEMTYWAS